MNLSQVLAADDPVTCATYFKENDLLYNDGWKRFRHLAKRDKHDLPIWKVRVSPTLGAKPTHLPFSLWGQENH